MKILVTGATGMVGRNICTLAKGSNHEILGPTSKELDLSNIVAVNEYLKAHKPDAVIHCAGLVGGIQANIKSPFDFAFINAVLGLNIVKAALDNGVPKVLNLGSSCMYPRNATNPLQEEDVLKGELEPTNEGYAIAKVLTARLCDYASAQYGANFKTIIPCNLYGYWDKFDPNHSHMIPAVIRKIHEAKSNGDDVVEIWGDGTTRREFMLAEDLADFCFFALDNFERLEQLTNVGLGHDFSILEYYQAIAKVVKFDGDFTFDLTKPAGMKQKLVSVDKIDSLGWAAKHSLEQGLQKTYEFYLREYCND
ncbi:TPA: GDP-L-fucose synthase [Vibrio parahaemolyticus]|nr:GDP-L-fucose synthase [Vibrio parahaemolyticus]MBM4848667.1 GDP-L-fucose synthase [Vibrio parahaemolyticus]MDF4384554.1 GDP-L-fucose synthase [Vibrio parahaemolyticus]HCE1506885.1 GDP-L-fucose synthase [Vibrio parahaemolyticus]HCE2046059.1 GDP-L-fucose synthase [Vibrio parahaemolyticus]